MKRHITLSQSPSLVSRIHMQHFIARKKTFRGLLIFHFVRLFFCFSCLAFKMHVQVVAERRRQRSALLVSVASMRWFVHVCWTGAKKLSTSGQHKACTRMYSSLRYSFLFSPLSHFPCKFFCSLASPESD